MKLPYSKNALVSRRKLTDYVLSETHPTGKFKAKFFRGLGFSKTNVKLLEEALRKLAHSQPVKEIQPSLYGTKYKIDGKIETPIGIKVRVRTVWIIEKGQNRPRFVTAYPV